MAIHEYSSVGNQNHSQITTQKIEEVAVVMVPLPAQGHLNQLLHLSRLISSHDISVHYVCTPAHTRQAKDRVHGWDPLSISNIYFHEFPVPPYQTPPPDPDKSQKFPTQMVPSFLASNHLRQPIFSFIQELSKTAKRIVVIHDSLMSYVVQDIYSLPNAESYAFQSVSAFAVYCYVWEREGKPEVPESQILQSMPDYTYPEEFEQFVKLQFSDTKITNSGNLFNSCREIEGPYLERISKFTMSDSDRNWAIGPFNPVVLKDKKKSEKRHDCLDWLDRQAPNSVIIVSFGSTTSLADEQVKEIAIGLEKSEQKFIWVIRDADKGDFFLEDEVRKSHLPEGFEKRIEGRGMMVTDWAPQLEILGHSSTGGFLSHCGWNSCMESMSHGVPIAAWPMHSDQPKNCVLITKLLKIGFTVRDWVPRDGIVAAKIIENAVRTLMDSEEGEEMRQRAQELSKAVKASIMEGASRLEMDEFVAHIRR